MVLTANHVNDSNGVSFGSHKSDVFLGERSDGISDKHFIVEFEVMNPDDPSLGIRNRSQHCTTIGHQRLVDNLRTTLVPNELTHIDVGSTSLRVNANTSIDPTPDVVAILGRVLLDTELQDYERFVPWQSGDRYRIDTSIYDSKSARVQKMIRARDGTIFAVKSIINGPLQHAYTVPQDTLDRELAVMKRLRHPNVARLVDHALWKGGLLLMIEFAPFGNLQEYMTAQGALNETLARSMAVDVWTALDYIHTQEILHRDVKPANILIMSHEPLRLVLTDFGTAYLGSATKGLYGSGPYVSPEVARNFNQFDQYTYDKKADIWSSGMIVYCLLTGLHPSRVTHCRTMYKVISQWSPQWPEDISDEAQELVQKTLKILPIDRPCARQCLDDAWHVEFPLTPSTRQTSLAPTEPRSPRHDLRQPAHPPKDRLNPSSYTRQQSLVPTEPYSPPLHRRQLSVSSAEPYKFTSGRRLPAVTQVERDSQSSGRRDSSLAPTEPRYPYPSRRQPSMSRPRPYRSSSSGREPSPTSTERPNSRPHRQQSSIRRAEPYSTRSSSIVSRQSRATASSRTSSSLNVGRGQGSFDSRPRIQVDDYDELNGDDDSHGRDGRYEDDDDAETIRPVTYPSGGFIYGEKPLLNGFLRSEATSFYSDSSARENGRSDER